MAEDLTLVEGSKLEKYKAIHPQIEALLQGEEDEIANMANVAAALFEQFQWLWVGFYRVQGDELVLGPFQGPVACTRIRRGQGVCGSAWERGQTLIVPDVETFPGHIACSSRSRSEIVLLYYKGGQLAGVLDVDSEKLNDFDETDAGQLAQILQLLD